MVKRLVAAYDEGGVKALGSAAARAPEITWASLVAACAKPESEVPATWVLLARAREGGALSSAQTRRLIEYFPALISNDARLHACQLVAHLEVDEGDAEELAVFLRDAAKGDHKFTRAWATDALMRLAEQHPAYRGEALKWLGRAEADPAASVRARARRIAAELR